MKKLVLFLTCALFLVGLTGCGGGGKYADAKDVYNDLNAVTEEFVIAADSARDADEAVAAFDDFFKKLSKLRPRIRRVMRKYPELKEENPEVEDAEMQNILDRVKEVNDEMNDAIAALNDEFGRDPKYIRGKKRVYREAGSN